MADCRAGDCGNVTIGACLDVGADMLPFADAEGGCVDGLTPQTAGLSCSELDSLGAASGMYWLDPDGVGAGDDAFESYCDMSLSEWTTIARAFDENYDTPPPAIGNGGDGTFAQWAAHDWSSNNSYYLSLDDFDALTDGGVELMQVSFNDQGQIISQLRYDSYEYDSSNNSSVVGNCINMVGSPCGANYAWWRHAPSFEGWGRNNVCNSNYPTKIFNYHNFASCASDSGLFSWQNSATARPQLIGTYTGVAHETRIMVRPIQP